MAARFFYTLMLCLLFPFIFLKLIWRARLQPEYLQHVAERFGFYAHRSNAPSSILMKPLANRLSPQADKSLVIPRNAGEEANVSLRDFSSPPVIWLHAVSVGETRATVSLVEQLRSRYPQHQIVLTHTTPTGRATSEQLYGDRVTRVYLPYDYPFAVRRFLRHFRPQLGMLMETEIWFNLIRGCQKHHVPLLLLNARMSERSARGYARFASLTRDALQALGGIAAQTDADAQRLTALGATQISVMGNLKFDIAPPATMLELGKVLRAQFGATRKVFLAASTREGEEVMLLDAWQAASNDTLLVIVPRHPQRFNEVAELIARQGLRMQRRSENRPVAAEVQVVLGDSMGEMFAYYAAADVAFIGGSLLPFGGQNLIEACAVGTPVLIGLHTHNFADATRLAVEAGAARRVNDASELVTLQHSLLSDENALAEMRKAGLLFVAAHQGATDKAMQVINLHLVDAVQ
jgi:3-deoxy-D-manno-octulosonic-acid transferase